VIAIIDSVGQADSGESDARVRVKRTYVYSTYIKDRPKVRPNYAARL
jgi:hypothetical protein